MQQRFGKVLISAVVLTALVAPATAEPPRAMEGRMNKAERTYLLQQLKSTEASLLKSVKGTTQEQWTFKPAPDSWSIQECMEHIILAEDLIFNEAKKTLETPPVPRLANANPEGDRAVVAAVEDRSKKAKAPKVLQPSGMFPTPESAIKEFEIRRSRTIAYVKSTQDPLRVHAGDSPAGGTADSYQFLLQLAAHCARHTAQLNLVKTAPGYPKS